MTRYCKNILGVSQDILFLWLVFRDNSPKCFVAGCRKIYLTVYDMAYRIVSIPFYHEGFLPENISTDKNVAKVSGGSIFVLVPEDTILYPLYGFIQFLVMFSFGRVIKCLRLIKRRLLKVVDVRCAPAYIGAKSCHHKHPWFKFGHLLTVLTYPVRFFDWVIVAPFKVRNCCIYNIASTIYLETVALIADSPKLLIEGVGKSLLSKFVLVYKIQISFVHCDNSFCLTQTNIQFLAYKNVSNF